MRAEGELRRSGTGARRERLVSRRALQRRGRPPGGRRRAAARHRRVRLWEHQDPGAGYVGHPHRRPPRVPAVVAGPTGTIVVAWCKVYWGTALEARRTGDRGGCRTELQCTPGQHWMLSEGRKSSAVVSTPIISRSGSLIWGCSLRTIATPHRPNDRTLQMLDLHGTPGGGYHRTRCRRGRGQQRRSPPTRA